MSNPEFAPGPWKTKPYDEYLIEIYDSGKQYIACVQPDRYANGDIRNMLKNNAHLIAKAPELYHHLHVAAFEFCHACQSMIDGEELGCVQEDGKCFVQEWIKTLREARMG